MIQLPSLVCVPSVMLSLHSVLVMDGVILIVNVGLGLAA
jgi:hypothetical protein